jgi:hypothetical protein
MIKQFARAMGGRSSLLIFGSGNVASSLILHGIWGPAWSVLMSFGLMGLVCMVIAPFVPEKPVDQRDVPLPTQPQQRAAPNRRR